MKLVLKVVAMRPGERELQPRERCEEPPLHDTRVWLHVSARAPLQSDD